jgi:hypothetical protein
MRLRIGESDPGAIDGDAPYAGVSECSVVDRIAHPGTRQTPEFQDWLSRTVTPLGVGQPATIG